jgi:hypothetical protein
MKHHRNESDTTVRATNSERWALRLSQRWQTEPERDDPQQKGLFRAVLDRKKDLRLAKRESLPLGRANGRLT